MTPRSIYSIHLSTAMSWRGGENQVWLLARGLRARGQKVLVVAPPKSPLLERCLGDEIPCHALKLSEINPLAAFRLASLLRREKPDVLHAHDAHAISPAQILSSTLPGSFRLIVHRRTVFKLSGRWKYSGAADRVIAISDSVRQTLLQAGVDDHRIRTVHSGMVLPEPMLASNPSALDFRKRHGIPSDGFIIAHAAALSTEKRQEDILAALHAAIQLMKKSKVEIYLAAAGTGDQEETLRSCARRLGLSERVFFLGFLRDLRPLWAISSMVIFASEAEGLCTALIEGQGAGLPAVITRAGGMVEVVEDGKTGFVINIGDTEAMAAAIVRLVNDPAKCREMGTAARERMSRKFSADGMVDGVLAVYRDVCDAVHES